MRLRWPGRPGRADRPSGDAGWYREHKGRHYLSVLVLDRTWSGDSADDLGIGSKSKSRAHDKRNAGKARVSQASHSRAGASTAVHRCNRLSVAGYPGRLCTLQTLPSMHRSVLVFPNATHVFHASRARWCVARASAVELALMPSSRAPEGADHPREDVQACDGLVRRAQARTVQCGREGQLCLFG
jgi:hypothetical protein